MDSTLHRLRAVCAATARQFTVHASCNLSRICSAFSSAKNTCLRPAITLMAKLHQMAPLYEIKLLNME